MKHPQGGWVNLAFFRLGLFLGELFTKRPKAETPPPPKQRCVQYIPDVRWETWFGGRTMPTKRGGRYWPWA